MQVVKNHGVTLEAAEATKGIPYATVHLPLLGLGFGRLTGRSRQSVDEGLKWIRPALAIGVPIASTVDRYPIEPGLNGTRGVKAGRVAIHAKEAVMEDVLGRLRVMGDVESGVIDHGAVSLIQQPQSLDVTTLELVNEIGIARFISHQMLRGMGTDQRNLRGIGQNWVGTTSAANTILIMVVRAYGSRKSVRAHGPAGGFGALLQWGLISGPGAPRKQGSN
jgi:hypothetical protein